ncbi:Polyketide synthase, enoylreductase [Penicillium digitatum]|uniref:Polyketide synthase, enoylreductase n=1 Tax=Penicillium digitatum TaxID=36651 RepID=A0A7T6XR42_PENDI|nr:Polyketide synthase, enoylreductase [Penicillium digitatum]
MRSMGSTTPRIYKQAVFKEQGASLTLEKVPLTLPKRDETLVQVETCGVCHSDHFAQTNLIGGGFPLVPGHEIIGCVAAVGVGEILWKEGDRIGGAWHEAAVHIPDHVNAAKYAPMLCAGVTVFNDMRHMKIPQVYASKFGYRVVALSRDSTKEEFARKLGAHDYIDTRLGIMGKLLILSIVGGIEVHTGLLNNRDNPILGW